MEGERTVILSTGIPGNEKDAFFKEARKVAKANGKDVKIYSVGDRLLELAGQDDPNFNPDNILNMPTQILESKVRSIYEEITQDIGNHEYSLISTHATFYWKNVAKDSGNARFLEKVKPDIYVTVVQAADEILKKLNRNSQWRSQNLSEEQVLTWQNYETMITQQYWAGMQKTRAGERPRYLVMPRNLPGEELFKLFLNKKTEFVYSAFPMTHLRKQESWDKIEAFQKRLREYFGVIDPKALDLKLNSSDIANNQTVHRDLDNFVGLTTKTVCYFPEHVFSSGALTEIARANDLSRDVYIVYSTEVADELAMKNGGKRMSPFPYYNTKKVFWCEDEFFDYLAAEGYRKLDLKRD